MTREEAINKLKHLCSPEQMTALRVLVPELAESEDEKTRKHIIELVKQSSNILCKQTQDAMIAYLEKQKAKARLDRMAPIYNDKESFESALEKAWKYYNESASRTVDSFEDDYIECVFSKGFREGFLYKEKQKEQKPSIEICPHSTKSKSYKEKGYPIEDCDYGLEIAFDILEKTFGEVQGYQTDDGIREHQTAIEAVRKAKEQKPLSTEEIELNSISFLEQLGYTCVPPSVQKPVEWKPEPESLEALMYAIEGKWEMIKPTSYLSRRLEDLYEGLVNTFNADESLVVELTKTAYSAKDIEEIKVLKRKIDESMEKKIVARENDFVSKEWSEEDEENLKRVIRVLEDNESDWKELSDWLKSLRPQPKVEWSEEDENYYDTIVRKLQVIGDDSGLTMNQIDFLEKHRPLPHWKPSEEQMKVFDGLYHNYILDQRDYKVLESLYNDLKKLI